MNEHICKHVEELNGSKAFQVKLIYEDGLWFFSHASIAIDVDVKGGEAETVGDESV